MTADRMEMTVNEYLKLPYAIDVRWDSEDDIFVARIVEIPECSGHGKSRNDAIEMAFDNLRDWIEDALEANEQIPKPAPLPELPSGKWLQRVPRRIHAELVAMATEDRVSLNQLVVSILSREVGLRSLGAAHVSSSIEGSADPSTGRWNNVQDEIAVNQSWQINDHSKSKIIHDAFLHRLLLAVPEKAKVKDIDIREYGEKNDHKSWN